DIDRATEEIAIFRVTEFALTPVVSYHYRLFRIIGVVGAELEFVPGLLDVENQGRVVDGQAGEAHEVHDRGTVSAEFGGQLPGRALLMTVAERKDHAPVATLEVTAPDAAALG